MKEENGTIFNNPSGPIEVMTMQNKRVESAENKETSREKNLARGKKTTEAIETVTLKELVKPLIKRFLIVAGVVAIFGAAFKIEADTMDDMYPERNIESETDTEQTPVEDLTAEDIINNPNSQQ